MVKFVILNTNGEKNDSEIKPTKKTLENFTDKEKFINYIKNKLPNKGKFKSLNIHKKIDINDSTIYYIGYSEGKDKNIFDNSFYEDIGVVKMNNKTNNYFLNLENFNISDYEELFQKVNTLKKNVDEEYDTDCDEIINDLEEEDDEEEMINDIDIEDDINELYCEDEEIEEEEEKEENEEEEEENEENEEKFINTYDSELEEETYNYPEEIN